MTAPAAPLEKAVAEASTWVGRADALLASEDPYARGSLRIYMGPLVSALSALLAAIDADRRVTDALDVLTRYGQTDGAHHKAWVIDQAVRALTGDGYVEHVRAATAGRHGPDTYPWDTGIAP